MFNLTDCVVKEECRHTNKHTYKKTRMFVTFPDSKSRMMLQKYISITIPRTLC